MRIRLEQLQAMEELAEERFVREIAAHVRQSVGTEPVDDACLVARVRRAVSRARQRGFTRDNDIVIFAVMMFVAGPEFDLWPAMDSILRDPRLSPSARIGALSRLPAQTWHAAATSSAHWDG